VSARARKLSANEAAFRAFNEGVHEVERRVGDSDDGEFACECSDPRCEERIRMPLDEYAHVRAETTRFVIKNGHEMTTLERVVHRTDDYAIVEKREGPEEI
jgi:hypothetical protein